MATNKDGFIFANLCFQAVTSALHTPRTMCVCVPVSRGAKSIDGTVRYAVSRHVFNNVFLSVPASHCDFQLPMGSECGRSKANESVQVIELIGSGHPHCTHVCCRGAVDDNFLMFRFFSKGKGDTFTHCI